MPDATIPDDDPTRSLVLTNREEPGSTWISLAGDTYTMLIGGEQTAGRYCLIDMHVPDGGGPPPHRHDFEEMFTILEGRVDFTFRGETTTAYAGTTVNIPANAPHFFHNSSGEPVRMLCMCTPAGQEEYFELVGDPVDGPEAPPPPLTDAEKQERQQKAVELAPRFASEILV